MEKYIKIGKTKSGKIKVETPYDSYEFDSEEEAKEFLNFVNSDPDYENPEIGDIVEWAFFYKKSHGLS